MQLLVNMNAGIHARLERVNMHTCIIGGQMNEGVKTVPVTLRLTKDEQRAAELKCREINKLLVNMERAPIQESELLHLVINKCIDRVKVNKRGEVEVE